MSEASPPAVEQTPPTEPAATPAASPAAEPETPAVDSPSRVYTQQEVDRIMNRVRRNAREIADKRAEAYLRGVREGGGAPQPKEQPKPEAESAPKREDYQDYESFSEAKAVFVARKATNETLAEKDKAAKDKADQESAEKRFNDFRERVKAKFPDIEERLDVIGEMTLPAGVGDAISESELAPELMNYLVQNPKECERLSKLSSIAAIREVGKIETRLEGEQKKPEGEPKPPAPKPSVPAPITPVSGKGSAPTNVIRDGMPYEEFLKVRNRQLGRVK